LNKFRGDSVNSQYELRERSSGPIEIDPKLLNKGLNVLAIELHRTDYPALCRSTKIGLCFGTIGLSELFLKAETPGQNIISSLNAPEKFRVWNADIWDTNRETDLYDPCEPLQPVRIDGVRNGKFSGKVMVESSKPIKNLNAQMSILKGPEEIPIKNIRVRFALQNPQHLTNAYSFDNGYGGLRFDMFLDKAPETIEPFKIAYAIKGTDKTSKWAREALGLPPQPVSQAVIPVWVTVKVPEKTKPGLYKGTLSISAKNTTPVKVPVELNVINWCMPDIKDFESLFFIYQSPESLCRYYGVKRWSEGHWKLIERSLKLMSEAGNIGLIFLMTAESCHGNPYSWVTWVKKPDSTYSYDFSIFDRYLDTALKYHDPSRIKVAAINVWGVEASMNKRTGKSHGVLVTERDSKTGELKNIKTPAYGTKECEDFWRPVLLEVRKRLAKRKLAEKMMFGVGSDTTPDKAHVGMFNRIIPGTPWFRESHFDSSKLSCDPKDKNKTVPVGCNSVVWGGGVEDPHHKTKQPDSLKPGPYFRIGSRLYGWNYNPEHLVLNFNRAGATSLCMNGFQPIWPYHMWMESTIAGGRCGNGRAGGDFFNFGIRLSTEWKNKEWVRGYAATGGGGTIFNIYPQSSVAQTGLGNNVADLFAPGPQGPVSTVRFENALLGNQEAEARIFIEKAILAKKLPDKLAKKCQDLLDKRTNALRMVHIATGLSRIGRTYVCTQGWKEKTRKLFELAAEVERVIGSNKI
jgi:hypothetical protein